MTAAYLYKGTLENLLRYPELYLKLSYFFGKITNPKYTWVFKEIEYARLAFNIQPSYFINPTSCRYCAT